MKKAASALLVVAASLVCGLVEASQFIPELTIVNARLYAHAGVSSPPTVNIVLSEGRIADIYTGEVRPGGSTIDARNRAVTAGFWNCHVHFTHPRYYADRAGTVRDMLLQYGFTAVVDTGSQPQDTLELKDDIESGVFAGPKILTAGGSFVYRDGTPAYLTDIKLPEIVAPEQAGGAVNAVLNTGIDGIKIFSGSFQSPEHTIHLPGEIVRAVAAAAHARGTFVIAHPTDRTGLANAVNNGVDVLAHTAPPAGELGAELIRTMLDNDVALIPTLKLWGYELRRLGVPEAGVLTYQNRGVAQLSEYFEAGGEVLFGTDVGYMDDWHPGEEYRLMHAAGMDAAAILASLTALPARRFRQPGGSVSIGAPADLVILGADPFTDPSADPGAFANVAVTIRGGRVVWQAPDPSR